MEIVFVGQCEVFVCLEFAEIIFVFLFFPVAAKFIGPRMGCQFFINVNFLDNPPLKGV